MDLKTSVRNFREFSLLSTSQNSVQCPCIRISTNCNGGIVINLLDSVVLCHIFIKEAEFHNYRGYL